MSGELWIASYVVLFVGVIASLATSLAVARQMGRVAVGDHHDSETDWIDGLAPEVPVPPLELLTTEGQVIRPHRWEAGLLLQVAVSSDEDVESIRQFESTVPPEFVDGVLVSAIGPRELLDQVTTGSSSRLTVFVDTYHQVAAALRTPIRPYALVARGGYVVAAGSFESVEELDAIMSTITAGEVEPTVAVADRSDDSQHNYASGGSR